MCTANLEICKKVKELKELRLLKEQLEAEIDALTDEVKAYMGEEESMVAGPFKVTFRAVTSSRLDSKALVDFLGRDALQRSTRPRRPGASRLIKKGR